MNQTGLSSIHCHAPRSASSVRRLSCSFLKVPGSFYTSSCCLRKAVLCFLRSRPTSEICSGALCGLAGFILVAGHHHTLSTSLAGGKGFTGVLIAWLGGFKPGQMILYATLVGIFDCGSRHAASTIGMSTSQFSAIVTGIFFLVVIASEFFVNYQIKLKVKDEATLEKKNHHALEVPSYETEAKEEKVEEPLAEVKEEKVEAPKAQPKKAPAKKENKAKTTKKPTKVQENKAKQSSKAKTNKSSKEAK